MPASRGSSLPRDASAWLPAAGAGAGADGSASEKYGPIQRVSIVTVCLNAAATIESTLASVRDQHCPGISVESVVIDGGSSDDTVQRAARYDPEVLISEPDSGIYPAMQKGVAHATGDAVFFLNSGDTLHDNAVLADVVRSFDSSGCAAVFGNLMPTAPAGPASGSDHAAFRAGVPLDFSYFCNRRQFYYGSIHHQTMFYRREVFADSSFLAGDSRADGEYHLNLSVFVRHGLTARHIDRIICDFSLGGHSTADFKAEWRRFTVARSLLRERFFPHGRNIAISDPYEYLQSPPPWPRRLHHHIRSSGPARWLAEQRASWHAGA